MFLLKPIRNNALLSDSKTKALLSDRVAFKLFAAEQYLINLKSHDSKYGIITKDRVYAEMEIDCFFAQIIGAADSLLFKINERFSLNITPNKIDLDSVYQKLKSIDRGDLLADLKKMATNKQSWFWLLNELRNHSIHRNVLNKQISIQLVEDINTYTSSSIKPEVYFLVNPRDENKSPMNKQVIRYLEESLQNMIDMIANIRSKDPLLKD
jgi:Cthe_2314-like HEPN